MTRPGPTIVFLFAALGAVAPDTVAQQPPPVRPLGPTVAIAKDTFSMISSVRQVSDGRVLVSDPGTHRLLLLDATLSNPIVVADSSGVAARRFGIGPGLLVAYPGDSTLFLDAVAASFVLIDPHGAIARVLAVPRAGDMLYLTAYYNYGVPTLDAQQRLVYRVQGKRTQPPAGPDGAPLASGALDSQAVIRGDFATRRIDTVGWVRVVAEPARPPILAPDGTMVGFTRVTNPIPAPPDDWAVLADGSIALIRGQDYHIDFVHPDGTRTSSGKVPHVWVRVDDAEKTRLVDSLRAYYEAHPTTITIDGAAKPPRTITSVSQVVPITALADYRPAFRAASCRPDADGHLWIQTAPPPAEGGLLYDVIDGNGVLIDRVQLPPSLSLIGFGPGVAYLTSREGHGLVLVKARIR